MQRTPDLRDCQKLRCLAEGACRFTRSRRNGVDASGHVLEGSQSSHVVDCRATPSPNRRSKVAGRVITVRGVG